MQQLRNLFAVASFPIKMIFLVVASLYPFRHRSKHFWILNLLAFSVLTIAITYFFAPIQSLIGMGSYGTVFVACIGIAYCCFEISWKDTFFCVTSCYAIEHISACFSICWQVLNGCYGLNMSIADRAVSDLIIYVVLVALYVAFIRRFHKQLTFVPRNTAVAILVITVLLIALVISTLQFSLNYTIQGQRDWVAFIMALLRMIACALVLTIQSNLLSNTELQTNNIVLQNLLAQERKRYVTSKESAEVLNIKYHDMKHFLTSLKALGVQGYDVSELISQVEETVDDYSLVRETGCTALNTVLYEKMLVCRKQGIRLTYMGDGSKLSFIKDIDIYAMIGNVLDNAMESVASEDAEKRYIDLKVIASGQFVKLCCENYCTHSVKFSNKLPVSSKLDTLNHGFGTKSITYIAQEYGGEVFFEQHDNLFRVTIVFSGASSA